MRGDNNIPNPGTARSEMRRLYGKSRMPRGNRQEKLSQLPHSCSLWDGTMTTYDLEDIKVRMATQANLIQEE